LQIVIKNIDILCRWCEDHVVSTLHWLIHVVANFPEWSEFVRLIANWVVAAYIQPDVSCTWWRVYDS